MNIEAFLELHGDNCTNCNNQGCDICKNDYHSMFSLSEDLDKLIEEVKQSDKIDESRKN